jgi:hypothetical protein
MDLHETRVLPPGLDDEALEAFVLTLAAQLAPGLERSVGTLAWRRGDRSGIDWSAQAHLEDGTLVVVTVQPVDASITLLVDNAPLLKPAPPDVGRWTYLGFAGVITLGFATGTWAESALWGTLASVSVLGTWVALDVYLQSRSDRAARERPLDVEHWRRRLDEAVELAGAAHRSSPE